MSLTKRQMRVQAKGYDARAGQQINGKLYRGGDGKFSSGAGGGDSEKTTPKKRRTTRTRAPEKRRANEAKVGAEAGLGQNLNDALLEFASPDEVISLAPQVQSDLLARGLIEESDDGVPRLSSAGRSYVAAARSGDVSRARDALGNGGERVSNAQERETKRTEAANKREARKQEVEAKRAQREAEKLKKAQEKKGGGGGGGKKEDPKKEAEKKQREADRKKRDAQRTAERTLDRAERARTQASARRDRLAKERSAAARDQQRAAERSATEKKRTEERAATQQRRSVDQAARRAEVEQRRRDQEESRKAPAALAEAARKFSEGSLTGGEQLESLIRNGLARRQRDGAVILTDAGRRAARQKSTVVVKDANGHDRWVSISSTAYEDKDKEIVSRQALKTAVALADRTGYYGPLRIWHEPGLDIGDCDFMAVTEDGAFLIESGTFRRPEYAARVKSAGDVQVSIGFLHPEGQPGPDLVYDLIAIFERSITPHGRASNRFTSLSVGAQDE